MAFWRTYYHLVWATKERQNLITADKETQLYNYIIGKADSLRCILHAIGGIENHIHLVVSIPPTLAVAEFVKRIKGSSSHYMNHELSSLSSFAWQNGYGVLSLGGKQLDTAVAYVKHQKEHHSQGNIIQSLEHFDSQEDAPKL